MTDLEIALLAALGVTLAFGAWGYRRARSVIAAEKAATFLYATSVLMDGSQEDFVSAEARLQWGASQLAQANESIDRHHLLILLRAASALRVLRQSFPGGSQRPLAELGGEQLRYLAIRAAGATSSPAVKAISARTIELARHLDANDEIADKLVTDNALAISVHSASDVITAQFAIEAAIGKLYMAAVAPDVAPLRSLQI